MNHEAGSDRESRRADHGTAARRMRSLRTIVEGAVLDVDGAMTLRDVGEDLLELTGYERAALEGADVSRILDDDAVAALERIAGTAEATPTTVQATVTTADGDRLAGELRAAPFKGEVSRVVGVLRTDGGVAEADDRTAAVDGRASAAGDVRPDPGERESEHHYATLVDRFPDGIVALYDADLQYTRASGGGFEKLSTDPSAIEGSDPREAWGEEAAERLEPVLRAALEGEEGSVELEYEGRAWLVRALPLGGDGSAAGATVAFDVTERRETERELRRREGQLSRLMRNVPGMVYRCRNTRGWPMEFVSDGCRELTGYDPERLESGELSFGRDLVVEADRDDVWRELQEVVTDREPFSITYRIETADGSIRWVADHGRGIFDDGELVGIEGVIIDVTERKRAEEALAEKARRYRTLLDNFPNGAVGLFDEDLRYVAAGGTVFEELDDSETNVVGQTVGERYPADVAEQLESKFRAALEGEASDFEFEMHDRVWRAHTYPIEDDDGNVSSGVIMVQDVTDRRERERELERSERRYRTLVDNFPNGAVALVDEEFRYRTIGGTPPAGIESTTDDLVGERVQEALPSPLAEKLGVAYEAAFEGESTSFEHESGSHDYRFYTVPVRDDDGEIFAAMGMSQDITAQKQQERQLREAKAQLEAATDAADIGTWEWHVPDDEFHAGASLAKIFGVDPEAAREGVSIERMTDRIYGPDRDRIEAKIQAAIDDCGEYEAEYRVRDADGQLRWVFARGRVECDDDGDPLRFPGALADITERKEAEEELQRQRNQLETLFEVLPVGVVVADADGRIVEANDTATAIWGRDVLEADSVADYEKYPVRDAATGDPVPASEMTLARVLSGEEVTDPDVYEIDAFDGERRIVRLEGRPIRDASGEVTRGVVTMTDITERRRYQERLEESNDRLEQFAYAASHDLQEPLRMVSSYLSLLERRHGDALDAEGEEFLEFAVDGADRMREMIDALLEYSRVETRGDPFEPVDLEAVLADVREDLQVQIQETDATVTAGDLPTVEGDRSQLRQVFQNLLGNAIEYSGEASPRVHVDATPAGATPPGEGADADPHEWVVSVADEGVGIDPEHQDSVFEVFQRLHSRADHEGTGIGLALCERIVERHGGDIWVESTPGEGSTFYLTLPVEVNSDDQ